MKNKLNLFLIINLLLLSATQSFGQGSGFEKYPYIVLKNNALAIQWQCNSATVATFKYKKVSASNYQTITISEVTGPEYLYEYNILTTELEKSVNYEYNVQLENGDIRSGTFISPPESIQTNLSFYGYGDTRGWTKDTVTGDVPPSLFHDEVCENILSSIADDPGSQTLLLHAGDWVWADQTYTDYWEAQYFNKEDTHTMELLSKIGVVGSIGNHESTSGEPYRYRDLWNYDYVNDNEVFNRSYDYGPIHFCIIDQRDPNNPLIQAESQKEWIKNDLINSNKRWKILLFHTPIYSTDFYETYNVENSFYTELLDNPDIYGINLVVNGHHHMYSDWLVNGVHHLTLGGGGAELLGVSGKDPNNPNIIRYQSNYHYAKFDATDNYIKVSVPYCINSITNEWGILDEFIIPHSYTIKSGENVIWEDYGVHYYADNIVVEDGASLTIKGDMEFKRNAGIIVKAGGELTLDGALLSCLGDYNDQETHWQGIEVWGKTGPYGPNDQGKLIMKNNATIENAIVGVRNYSTEGTMKSGGIIQASNSHFVNNKIAVHLSSTKYNLANAFVSYFYYCDFETNSEYQISSGFDVFAELSQVNDIIFNHCDFKVTTSQYQGIAIRARDANFRVTNNSTFTKFAKSAIRIFGSYSAPSKIINSTFTNNIRGIYISGVNEMEITNDTLLVPPDNAFVTTYGIYLEDCDGYLIQDNAFESYTSDIGSVGLYIKNSGSDNNEVYENKFENLDYGAIAYGRNRHGDEPSGLCFKCNEFANNQYDIAVFGEKAEDGIRDNQGSNALEATAPAANLFSTSAGSIGLENQGTHFTYWLPWGTGTNYKPNDWNGPITYNENQFQDWTYEDNCPPSGGGNGGITTDTERSAMVSNEAKSDSTQDILDLLVDGGDTQGTTQDVETAYPPETYQVYNELMNKSPYLSDNVVKASIEKEEVLPNVMIRDIMVANPQSAKEKDLMDKIDERTTPMPDYMKAQILAGKDLVGYMEKLESEKGHYAQKRATAYHNLIRLYQQDSLLTTDAKLDSVIVLVSAENTLFAQYRLAMLYFAKEDYSVGQNILSAIPNAFTLNAEQSTEHSYFTDYYQIATDLAISNDTITTQQISDLEYIMEEEAGLSAAYARNLLIAHNAMDYVEEVIIPEGLHFAAHPQEQALQEALEAHSYLNLYPNPAKDYLIVKYELEMEYPDAQLQIYDSKGSLIKTIAAENIQDQKVISTTDFKAGTYYIHFYFNHKEMESQKFTIIK